LEKQDILGNELSDISETLLLTLYCRALETKTKDPVLIDPKAVELTEKLNQVICSKNSQLRSDLSRGRIRKELVLYIALRAREYDRIALEFLKENPKGAIINLGCGLDTRFFRIDDGKLILYDLDLPEVIDLKRRLISETERYRFIASSVLDRSWMEHLKERQEGPFLFLAEGLFMYLPQDEVKKLVIELHRSFPGSHLACEMANSIVQKTPIKELTRFKMRKQLHLGKGAFYSSGISDGKEIEGWAQGIKYLGDWSYFDENEKKLGLYRMMKHVPFFRKMQWTVRYQI
jgi:methyltransferase (TIGR00027 family)